MGSQNYELMSLDAKKNTFSCIEDGDKISLRQNPPLSQFSSSFSYINDVTSDFLFTSHMLNLIQSTEYDPTNCQILLNKQCLLHKSHPYMAWQ